jgi:hypothetical protein
MAPGSPPSVGKGADVARKSACSTDVDMLQSARVL